MSRNKPVNPINQQQKVGGKLLPYYPPEMAGDCWLCGRRVGWRDKKWGGKYWCWRHHPRSRWRMYSDTRKSPRTTLYLRAEDERGAPFAHRYFGNSGVHPDVKGLPQAKIAKGKRKADAVLGRKKVKRSRSRRKPRDRQYVR